MRTQRQHDILFFAKRAGHCTPPGRMICAKQLADAEKTAKQINLKVTWEYETDIDDSWCDRHQQRMLTNGRLEVFRAYIEDDHGNILASLGNIFTFSDDDSSRRVYEAELYLEALQNLLLEPIDGN